LKRRPRRNGRPLQKRVVGRNPVAYRITITDADVDAQHLPEQLAHILRAVPRIVR